MLYVVLENVNVEGCCLYLCLINVSNDIQLQTAMSMCVLFMFCPCVLNLIPTNTDLTRSLPP